jgi:chemotaxis protein CheC
MLQDYIKYLVFIKEYIDMTEPSKEINQELYNLLQSVAKEGLTNAANGLSTMVGANLRVDNPCVKMINVKEIPMALGGPENEAVGIYLKSEGDLSGHFMLIIPYLKALELVDMLMEVTPGSTTELGAIERSALAEVGNLTTAFFLNAVAALTGIAARPTPPAVMVDMVGAILDIIVAATGGIEDYVLTFQASFICKDRSVQSDFWVIPNKTTLKVFADKL